MPSEKKYVGPKIPRLPKGARPTARPDEAYSRDGKFIIVCSVCEKWRLNYAYGLCRKCHRALYGRDSEDLEPS